MAVEKTGKAKKTRILCVYDGDEITPDFVKTIR